MGDCNEQTGTGRGIGDGRLPGRVGGQKLEGEEEEEVGRRTGGQK